MPQPSERGSLEQNRVTLYLKSKKVAPSQILKLLDCLKLLQPPPGVICHPKFLPGDSTGTLLTWPCKQEVQTLPRLQRRLLSFRLLSRVPSVCTHMRRPELTHHARENGKGEAPCLLTETISRQEAPHSRGEQQAGELHLCHPQEGSKQDETKPIWSGEEPWLMERSPM